MPLSTSAVDALGVVTICLVGILFLLGFSCILYSSYFHRRIRSGGFTQLGYFCGPWVIRIVFIFFALWWGFGEIVRLNLLRHHGSVSSTFTLKWQKNVCKGYIVSNLGFSEPCFFLTLAFLLHSSLQKSGPLSQHWNHRTIGCLLLFCLPLFVLQLTVILIGPRFNDENKLPSYFIASALKTNDNVIALCTYPLLSTIFLGGFATILTAYLLWVGRRILSLVINKGLKKRVYAIILSVCGFFPLRVLLLGLTVLSKPEHVVFETLSFLAFLSLLCCLGVGICILVYFPVADSLALGNLPRDIEEARRRFTDEQRNENIPFIANQSVVGESASSSNSSPGRNSSPNHGSISFRAMEKDETSGPFVELNVFSATRHSTPPGSPGVVGWSMLPPSEAVYS